MVKCSIVVGKFYNDGVVQPVMFAYLIYSSILHTLVSFEVVAKEVLSGPRVRNSVSKCLPVAPDVGSSVILHFLVLSRGLRVIDGQTDGHVAYRCHVIPFFFTFSCPL